MVKFVNGTSSLFHISTKFVVKLKQNLTGRGEKKEKRNYDVESS